MTKIHELLAHVKQSQASDLHLAAGSPPQLRRHGQLAPIAGWPTLDDQAVRRLIDALCDPEQRERFEREGDLDFAFGVEGVARFRANHFLQEGGAGAVYRLIPDQIPALADLKLPAHLGELCKLRSGLVLVAGPNGSGKTTTLAAMIDQINAGYARHIVTVEDPLEFVHRPKKSVVSQREVGSSTASFGAALKGAIRQDADVIVVGELRDLESIGLAITAAEMGLLVLGTLQASSAAKALDRLIDAFPSGQRGQVRASLAESLQAVVVQLLLPTADGKGRVPAVELLVSAHGLGSLIREGKTIQIDGFISTGKKYGMQSFDDALQDLADQGVITRDEALLRARDKKRFEGAGS